MPRALPTTLALVAALGLPATAQAQTGTPTPARGKAVLVTTGKGSQTASFVAGPSLDVAVTYRRRSSSTRTVRLAARLKSGKRCPARPSSADRRRLGSAVRSGSSYFTATGSARFGAGVNRVCLWAQEGSRRYRRLAMQRPTFARSLFGATTAEGTHVGLAVTGFVVASSTPFAGNRVVEGIGGRGGTCQLEDEPLASRELGGVHIASLSHATGAACTRLAFNAAGSAGSASLAAGPTAVGAPSRVVQHAGDCNPDITRTVPVPGASAATFMAAAGCRLGRVISGTSETRKRAGMPADGSIFMVLYRGKLVSLAPAGTTVDVVIDDRR